MKPIRLQRSRAKGSRLTSPNGLPVVCVTRPGPFGNPFRVGTVIRTNGKGRPRVGGIYFCRVVDAAHSVRLYRMAIEDDELPEFLPPVQFDDLPVPDSWNSATLLKRLRGKNLACWCKPGEPCHADVLLELANGDATVSAVTSDLKKGK